LKRNGVKEVWDYKQQWAGHQSRPLF